MIRSALVRAGAEGGFTRSRYLEIMNLALALSCAACGSSPMVLTAFRTEQQAQEHCPKDSVVWLDPQSGLFELKGHRSYGLSVAGRYACRSEAERAGMRAVTN